MQNTYKNWRNVYQQTPGYVVAELSKWMDFVDYINDDLSKFNNLIWRGQRDSTWKLEPTMNRLKEKLNVTDGFKFEQDHLETFQYASRGRRGPIPTALTENEWWAIGQHYGLATPLLDWSHSPFVAAFFAFIEEAENTSDDVAIYALHKPTVEQRVKEKKLVQKEKFFPNLEDHKIPYLPDLEFFKPLSDDNQRLVNQNGLFSRSPANMDIEQWVASNFNDLTNGWVLAKLLIPRTFREECLRNLNRMNINHLTLFPDLSGAATFTNLNKKIENY